ncbi:MAG: hypothetical protein KDA42_12195 [Planctomycetales bacterium]|nr:hypothetical protein [Planctomycetales bacterium]
MMLSTGFASTTQAVEIEKATSSRSARDESLQAMPWRELSPDQHAAASYVVKNTSIYRRLPKQQVTCDPQMYSFLLKHPEVIVNLWEVMGVGMITLDRVNDVSFRCVDGQGTACNIHVLHGTPHLQMIYAEGVYEGPMFRKPLKGRCLILLRNEYHKDRSGNYVVTSTLDSFIHLERTSIELIAKTFQPLIGKVADFNFSETMYFVSSLSHTASKNPSGVARVSRRLERVEPNVRDEFARVSLAVGERATASRPAEGVRQASTR